MIKLPFEFSNYELNEYNKKIIGYKGYDLSFLTSKTTNFINNWNLPDVSQGHDDREIEITYQVSGIEEAKSLARLHYISGSSNTVNKLFATDKDGNSASMKYVVDSISWDDWTNDMKLTVHLITESGFIVSKRYNYADWGAIPVEPNGYEDILIRVKWSTPPSQDVRINFVQTGYEQFDTEIYLRAANASEFFYNTFTGAGQYGDATLAEAIQSNNVKFTKPENLLVRPGSGQISCSVGPSGNILADSYIIVYSREFVL